MATPKPARRIIYSPAALSDLDMIWQWNAQQYSPAHADYYLQFLSNKINKLTTTKHCGRPIVAKPVYRYLLIRRKSAGHGHVVVFRLADDCVRVLRVYHTSQNWQSETSDIELKD